MPSAERRSSARIGSAALKEALKLPLALSSCARAKSRLAVVRIDTEDFFEFFSRLNPFSREGVDFAQGNAGAHQTGIEPQGGIQKLGCLRIVLLTNPNGAQCGPGHRSGGSSREGPILLLFLPPPDRLRSSIPLTVERDLNPLELYLKRVRAREERQIKSASC